MEKKLIADDIALRICGEIPKEEDMFRIKFRKKRNQFTDLIDLYTAEFPVRREEEPITVSKEADMKCALCGKQLDIYNEKTQTFEYPECGRPLVDDVVCRECKAKCRNYEDAVKASYPNSIQYYPRSSDLEDK